MSSLKSDLDEYLLLQSDQKKSFNVKLPQLKVPSLGLFSKNAEPEANSWLKDTQDSCCPKLVRLHHFLILTFIYNLIVSYVFSRDCRESLVLWPVWEWEDSAYPYRLSTFLFSS